MAATVEGDNKAISAILDALPKSMTMEALVRSPSDIKLLVVAAVTNGEMQKIWYSDVRAKTWIRGATIVEIVKERIGQPKGEVGSYSRSQSSRDNLRKDKVTRNCNM